MIARALTALATALLMSSVALAQQTTSPPEPQVRAPGVVTATRFSETLALPAQGDKLAAQSLEVSLGKLSVSGSRRIEVPPMGFYVATLVTGDLVTNIGGQETLRRPGDSWSVKSGETMVVQLQGKSTSALFQLFMAKAPGSAQ